MDLPCLAIRLPATVNIVISICDLGASRDYKTLPDLPSHKGGYIMNDFFFFLGGVNLFFKHPSTQCQNPT